MGVGRRKRQTRTPRAPEQQQKKVRKLQGPTRNGFLCALGCLCSCWDLYPHLTRDGQNRQCVSSS